MNPASPSAGAFEIDKVGQAGADMAMVLELSTDQARELRALLDGALGDLSHEIAATDNAEYRMIIRERRDILAAIRSNLETAAVDE
ncbi:MAG: hypothetical protein ACLP6E_03520 [Acidimicrobiales bacterium]